MSEWTDVAHTGEIAPGTCKIIDLDDSPVAVYNLEGQHYAIEDLCTHDGGDLATGEVDGDEVVCPRHGARFCIRDGRALTAPAYEDVHCFPLRIEAGLIQIRDDRWD